jgi:hypothetical protein
MMRKRLLWRLLPVLMLVAVFVLSGVKPISANIITPPSGTNGVVVSDDFSGATDSLWNVLGSATKHTEDGENYIELTHSGSQVGTIWLKQNVAPPYTATFQFRIKSSSGQIADGIVFMFNKLQNVNPSNGGGMGYEVGNGYGIEFDTYLNTEDRVLCGNDNCPERYVHTALFQNTPIHSISRPLDSEQLDTTGTNTIDTGVWHSVRVEVGINSVQMYLDNQTTPNLNYEGVIDSRYNGIGFSASTGLFYSQQQIRDVTITKPIPLLNDASLSTLNLSGVTLDQPVNGSVYAYTATVPNSISVTSVTYTTANSLALAALTLDGNPVNNPISLSEGTNVIRIMVTAEDGSTQKTYTVTVTRVESSNTNELKDLNNNNVLDIVDVILTIKQNLLLKGEDILQLLKQIGPKYLR